MNSGLLVILLGFLGVAWGYSKECGEVYGTGVTRKDQAIIVNKHNDLRKLIANGNVTGQPRGVNLKRMRWDDSLAAKAQEIAETCRFTHKQVDDSRWHAVGQNLYIKYSTASYKTTGCDWDEAIQSWFDEYKDYKYGECCNSGPKMTGHYTQVVWADTEYVGCGGVYYGTNDYFHYRKLCVCNYGPAGNYIGQRPYKTGASGCENLC